MYTLIMSDMLMSVFVPIGIFGAAVAVVCALVAAYALATGSAGLAGGAVGVWIVGGMLSLAASFANTWTPVLVALIALGGALVLGAMLNPLVRRLVRMRTESAEAVPVAS